ncbi:MAG: glycosyl transferase family 2 [Naasia sp.]|nr:glycosyl transferase family 2 [Naasia sp.]
MTPPATSAPSVVIAVLTYKRPQDIAAALPLLAAQAALVTGAWRPRIVVVDNDPDGSARTAVERFAASAEAQGVPVQYEHEPVPGISAGRNRALDAAAGDDVLVFIDDDERPSERWLPLLLETYSASGATAVVGPVISEYEVPLSPWVTAGRFFDRRRMPTGTAVQVAATNNLLLDLHTVRSTGVRFDPQFGLTGGGDTFFTLQFLRAGGSMVWCNEAIVVDVVPAKRATREWVLKRALRSGNHWARTSLVVANPGTERLALRVKLVGNGLGRAVAGGARALLGAVTGNLTHQARGARTWARGAGMLLGAFGYIYTEYKRS